MFLIACISIAANTILPVVEAELFVMQSSARGTLAALIHKFTTHLPRIKTLSFRLLMRGCHT